MEGGWTLGPLRFCGGDIDQGTPLTIPAFGLGNMKRLCLVLGMSVRAVGSPEGFGLCDGRPHGSRGVGQWRHRLQLHR